MKKILIALLLGLTSTAHSTNYYVSASGNDAANGLTISTAWQTVAKVNTSWSTISAADSILFKRGDIFYGSITLQKNNIIIASYGPGANPIIYGYTVLTGWTDTGGGIYEATVFAPNALNMVTVNGVPKAKGRFPDASTSRGGFKTFQKGTLDYIIDTSLTGSEGYAGSEISIKVNPFKIDRKIVTSQNGDTLFTRNYYSLTTGIPATPSTPLPKHGYILSNKRTYLTENFEWFYDSVGNKLAMYFGSLNPNDYTVQVSALNKLIDAGLRTGTKIINVDLKGANEFAITSFNGNGLSVKNSNISNSGKRGIYIRNTPNVLLDNVQVKNTLSLGIEIGNKNADNVSILNCSAVNSGIWPTMGSWYGSSDNGGISVGVDSFLTIKNTRVDTVGFTGITFQGNNVLVDSCNVTMYNLVQDDGGGIYTWVAAVGSGGRVYNNRLVSNCTVDKGIGSNDGTPRSATSIPDVAAFYDDGYTMNTLFKNCKAINSANVGFQLGNGDNNRMDSCVEYNCRTSIVIIKPLTIAAQNISIKHNRSYLVDSTFKHIQFIKDSLATGTLADNISTIGVIDSNVYNNVNQLPYTFVLYSKVGSVSTAVPASNYSFSRWKQLSGFDLHSVLINDYKRYNVTNTLSVNKVTNGTFNTSTSPWLFFGSNTTFGWVTGTGRLSFSTTQPNKYAIIYQNIGAVSSAKKYLLKFTTNSNVLGSVVAYFRNGVSPYQDIVARQFQSLAVGIEQHEFLISSPTTLTKASICLGAENITGNVTFDNIELKEVTATWAMVPEYVTSEIITVPRPNAIVKNIIRGYKFKNKL